jgi:hypothetical protein
VQAQAHLLQVVPALRRSGCFARSLHGGQEDGDQQADNGNDN